MKKAFNREYPIICDADTEVVSLMREIIELVKKKQDLEARRKERVSRLVELMEEDPSEPGPHGYLQGPDCEAHWCTNPKSVSWDHLKANFPEVYEALKGDERRSAPFLVVTSTKK